MSAIISCSCGVKIRVPPGSEGQAFRCPQCKGELLVASGDRVVTAAKADESKVGSTCPICQTRIQAGEPVVSCPECEQIHHRECWTEVSGCGTYGCKQAPREDKAAVQEDEVRSAWGDTKRCPACGETIKAVALRCRFCKTEFDRVDPMTVKDLTRQAQRDVSLETTKKFTIAIFVASVIGCLAPLMIIVSLAWVLPKRAELDRAGPIFKVIGYASIVLSGIYSVLILLFWMFDR